MSTEEEKGMNIRQIFGLLYSREPRNMNSLSEVNSTSGERNVEQSKIRDQYAIQVIYLYRPT